MNPRYTKGRRNEYKAKKILEAKGYQVFRSAGSKGPFDLLALGKYVIPIQVKTNRKPGKPEMKRLKKIDDSTTGWIQIWVFHDRMKDPEIFNCNGGIIDLADF